LVGSIGKVRGEQGELRASQAKSLGSIDGERGEQSKPRASIAK
jgi:hypothetical protein